MTDNLTRRETIMAIAGIVSAAALPVAIASPVNTAAVEQKPLFTVDDLSIVPNIIPYQTVREHGKIFHLRADQTNDMSMSIRINAIKVGQHSPSVKLTDSTVSELNRAGLTYLMSRSAQVQDEFADYLKKYGNRDLPKDLKHYAVRLAIDRHRNAIARVTCRGVGNTLVASKTGWTMLMGALEEDTLIPQLIKSGMKTISISHEITEAVVMVGYVGDGFGLCYDAGCILAVNVDQKEPDFIAPLFIDLGIEKYWRRLV